MQVLGLLISSSFTFFYGKRLGSFLWVTRDILHILFYPTPRLRTAHCILTHLPSSIRRLADEVCCTWLCNVLSAKSFGAICCLAAAVGLSQSHSIGGVAKLEKPSRSHSHISSRRYQHIVIGYHGTQRFLFTLDLCSLNNFEDGVLGVVSFLFARSSVPRAIFQLRRDNISGTCRFKDCT
jgi:hypothetical protein